MPCTTLLIGKKASYDGSTIIARNDDGPFEPKRVIVTEAKDVKKKYKCTISHLEIEIEGTPCRYVSSPSVEGSRGIWEACGINEYNVAMNATETITTNALVFGADPLCFYKKAEKKGEKDIIGGIGEEDLVTLILPYIKSAKEGVYRLASLLEKYGTYEMNGIAFSDANEIWWVETIGGHHFIAIRVPDDKVVIMPNQFGMDHFDFEDGLGKQENFICSKDLKEFMISNHLYTGKGNAFNPRLAFGSHADSDHCYNTPRSWYLTNFFNKEEGKKYHPESDNIPFMLDADRLVTIEDVKYILSSYYQGTPYNPYGKDQQKGKYRVIGVPNTEIMGIQQIRGYLPKEIQCLEWVALGGSAFTCLFPIYTNIRKTPKYLNSTTLKYSGNNLYWDSRILAALVDANYADCLIFSERYEKLVSYKSHAIINEFDKKMMESKDYSLMEEANAKIEKLVVEETKQTIHSCLHIASCKMKTRYNRGDN